MEKLKSGISGRQLTATVVLALVTLSAILALMPGVMAGDPTGARTLEENPGAPVD
jgi:hypothetical protein